MNKNWGKILCLLLLGTGILSGCRTNKEVMLEQAVNGNPYFQGVLAEGYLNGMIFKINYDLAAKWAVESTAKNDPVGMYTLGIIKEYGLGSLPVDRKEATRLYVAARPGLEKLAAENTLQAMYDLGTMYLYGRGVDKNYQKAFMLLNSAANREYAPAMADLAGMYMNGYSVNVNVEAARKLLFKAAQAGLPEAQTGLAGIYFSQQKYIPALNWYQAAAAKNSPAAMTALAMMYRDGVGVEKNLNLAEGYFNQASQMFYPRAMTELATLCLDEKRPSYNADAALKWYRQAIDKEYSPALVALGDYYFKQAANSPQAAVKGMILYQLASSNGLKTPNVKALDAATGLYFFIRYCWGRCDSMPSMFYKYNSAMPRMITGFQSGIITANSEVFRKSLPEQWLNYYYSNDWYLLYALKMPLCWSADILQMVPPDEKNTPFYWLCYGTCANLCGRPELTMTAVKRLLELAAKENDARKSAELKDLAVIMRTSALVQRGMRGEAYRQLAVAGRFTADPDHLRNYLMHFALPAIDDPVRFAEITGLLPDAPVQKDRNPVAQPFLDSASGKITAAQIIIPEPTLKPSEFEK